MNASNASNVDDLVSRLREARRVRNESRLFKTVRYGLQSWADDDDDIPPPPPSKSSSKSKKKLNLNNVRSAMSYCNHYFLLGINSLGFQHTTEDASSQILYDLVNFPLDMVMQRLEREGAWIEK